MYVRAQGTKKNKRHRRTANNLVSYSNLLRHQVLYSTVDIEHYV